MGWTSYHATHYNKNGSVNRKAECDGYFLEGLNRGYYEVLKSAIVGRIYYAAVRPLLKASGDEYEPIPENERITFGVVMLTSTKTKDYYNFSYKIVTEDMGPAEYTCPESILKLLDETDSEWAKTWRNRCHLYNKTVKSLNQYPVGTVITVNGVSYTKSEVSCFKKPTWINWQVETYIKVSAIGDMVCNNAEITVVLPK